MSRMRQKLGAGATAVQVDGDNNTITVCSGAATLTLDQRHKRMREPKSERDLLLTDVRATTLVGREAEVQGLLRWLESDGAISVRCLTGRGGSGKTRLGIELCSIAEGRKWIAGFARQDELRRFYDSRNLETWTWPKPMLIVADYAAASAHVLGKWLDVLAARAVPKGQPPLRILLLERHADAAIGWWSDLIRPGSLSHSGPDSLVDSPVPSVLPVLSSVDDRRALLADVMRQASRLRSISPEMQPPPPGADIAFDQRLAEPLIDNEPLYLAMAGLVALDQGVAGALVKTRTELAALIAESERRRLRRLAEAWEIDSDLVTHLVGCVTLEGGCGRDALRAALKEERAALELGPLPPADRVIARMAEALPGTEGATVDAIRPDLIGEAFLIAELARDGRPPAEQAAIVERAWRRSGQKVVASVVRTIQDYAFPDTYHASLAWFDRIFGSVNDIEGLTGLAEAIPESTLALRERAVAIRTRLVKMLSPLATAPDDKMWRLASALNNLAMRLAAIDDGEAALQTAQRATALYRSLAVLDPEGLLPELAMSLNNLGNRLRAVGRHEDALAAAREAAEIRRHLVASRGGAFLPDLAMSSNNLCVILNTLGRPDEALMAAQEAVLAYDRLAALRGDAFLPDVAMSLVNLSVMLNAVGHQEDALVVAHKALEAYRRLAASRLDAVLPDLAGAFNNLAVMLTAAGRPDAALGPALEALNIYRGLADSRPGAFLAYLATALSNIGNTLAAVGRLDEALEAVQEAVRIRRGLAAARPHAFLPDLAMALGNLGNRLTNIGRRDEALKAAQEASEIFRGLASSRPDAFLAYLAQSLTNLAAMLADVGRPEHAAGAAQEASDIRGRIAESRSESLLANLGNGSASSGAPA